MEFAEPRVVGQSCLLRRCAGGALDGQQPLAQHYATLQFLGSLVLAVRKIDNTSCLPELLPISCRPVGNGSKRFFRQFFPAFQELTAKRQLVAFGLQHPVVLPFLAEGCRFLPLQRYVVDSFVDDALQYSRVVALGHQLRPVLVICLPVAGVIAMSTRRVGETKVDGRSRTFYLTAYQVERRVAYGSDTIGRVLDLE